MSSVRFIADLHLGHKRICEFSGEHRGGCKTVEEHDDWIIKQWNSVVTKRDTVWVLGDVCFDKTKLPLLKELRGNKHLILGNHDNFALEAYQPYFDKIHGFLKYKGVWLSHAPVHPQELRGRPNIHGHNHHNIITDDPRYFCASVENIGGQPMEFSEILSKLAR